MGVSRSDKRWRVRINGLSQGTFDTEEEAREAETAAYTALGYVYNGSRWLPPKRVARPPKPRKPVPAMPADIDAYLAEVEEAFRTDFRYTEEVLWAYQAIAQSLEDSSNLEESGESV